MSWGNIWGGGFGGGGGGVFSPTASLLLNLALAVAENIVRVTFSEPIYFSNLSDVADAADPAHFNILPVSGIGIDGVGVQPVTAIVVAQIDDAIFDVTTDRPFSQWPCIYSVTVNGVRKLTSSSTVSGLVAQFVSVQAGMRAVISDQIVSGRDFANPQTHAALFDPLPNASELTSAALGTYQHDGTGDYANDEGLVSYEKRILRRILSRKNGFAHLSGYGVGVPEQVKRLAKPGIRQQLASDAEAQIRLEPETQSVAVRVVVQGDVTLYQIRAKTKFGPISVDLPIPNRGG